MELIVCPVCGAMAVGEPPHGWKQPCPQKIRIDDAYVDKLDAEKGAVIAQAMSVRDMAEQMKPE